MKIIFSVLIFLGSLFGNNIVGYYLLPKNDQGVESIARVFEKDGKYYAYGFASKSGVDIGLDVKNPNKELQTRKIRGIVFLWNLQQKPKDENSYINGKIYNYSNGKTYYAKAEFKNDTLSIKASVDSSGLFGKTLVWKKLTQEEVEPYLSRELDLEVVEKTIPQD